MDAVLQPVIECDRSPGKEERLRFRGVFFDVSPAMFLGSLDQTIVAAALPAISASLGGFAEISWIVTAYLLAATIAAPIYGRLGDAYGRQRMLIWALALFTAGSLACAAAPALPLLILARGLQGLGGGGIMTLAQALIGEVISPKERGRFQGWFGAIFALASTLGPVAGGLLSEHFGWRTIFWVNIPLGFAAAIAALRMKASGGAGRFSLDVKGTFLFVAATLAMLLALSLGATVGWLSRPILGFTVIALCGFAFLAPIERRSVDPLIPIDLMSEAVVWRAGLCVLLFAAVLFSAIVQLPLFLQLALGVSPTTSGLMLVPLTLAQVAVSTATGIRISTTGHPRGPMAAGLAIAAVGLLLMSLTLGFGLWPICASSVLFGFGLGTTMPAAQTLAQWAAGSSQLGVVTAALSFARSIGGVIGAAVTSAILLAALQVLAPGAITQVQSVLSSSESVVTPTLTSQEALTAFRWVFAAMAAIAAIAAAVAWSVPDVDLSAPAPNRSVAP